MELIYLWVEEYKNINKQRFNFSPRFECTYDEVTQEITIDEKKDYVNIFPENINITAIVGENGSGKSNLLELLFLPHKSFKENNFKYIIFYYKERVVKYWSSLNISVQLNNNKEKNNIVLKQMIDYNLNDINVKMPSGPGKNYYDNFVRNKIKKTSEYYNSIRYEQVILIKSLKLFQKNKNINLKEKSISFNKLKLTIKKLSLSEYIDDKIKNKYKKLLKNYLSCNSDIFSSVLRRLPELQQLIFINMLTGIINYSYTFEDANNFMSILDMQGNQINFESIESLQVHEDILTLLNLSKKLIDELDKYDLKLLKNGNIETGYEVIFDIQGDNNILHNFIEKYNVFISLYQEDYLEFQMIDIDLLSDEGFSFSHFSDGEKNIYSKMVELKYEFLYNRSNYFLLLDEPDNFLHPNWTKELISIIINNTDKNKENIHYILTSHSPFILSDLPKENVIFLKKDKDGNCINSTKDINIKPFGANIHTLLSHGFFMKNGLMGEFSKGRINETIKFLNKEQSKIKNEKEAKNIIDKIGEPFLQEKLLELYDTNYPPSKEQKIQRLKNQIKELENDNS